jgi:hypothetical protein
MYRINLYHDRLFGCPAIVAAAAVQTAVTVIHKDKIL